MEAISTDFIKILQDPNKTIIAGGTESMSNILLYTEQYKVDRTNDEKKQYPKNSSFI